MDFQTAKANLSRKLDIDYANIDNNDVFSDDDLGEYINTACFLAWNVAFWDFSEHSKTATLVSSDITNGYIDYPSDFSPSSIYFFQIDGKEQSKKNQAGFLRHFERDANSKSKIWCEHKREIFFNVNVASVGSIVKIFGKKNFTKLSSDTDLLPFSPDNSGQQLSGNDAIILLAYALALSSDKKKEADQAVVEEKRAYGILGVLKQQLEAGKNIEQPINTPMFKVPDMYSGGTRGTNQQGRFNI